MGFDLGAALNAGAGAYTNYLRGQQQRSAYDQQQARLDAEQQRQVQQDAMQSMLRTIQIQQAQQAMQSFPEDQQLKRALLQAQAANQQAEAGYHTKETTLLGQPKPAVTPWAAAGFPDEKSYLAFERQKALAGDTTPHYPPADNIKQDAEGNYYIIDPRTGRARPVSMPGGPTLRGPRQGVGAEKPPTESENKAAALLMGARDAAPILSGAPAPGFGVALAERAGANFALPGQRQVIDNAAFQFMDAYLRLVSGANLPEAEVRRMSKEVAPQFGDSPEVRKRKAANIATKLKAMEVAAGRALPAANAAGGPQATGVAPSDPILEKYGLTPK